MVPFLWRLRHISLAGLGLVSGDYGCLTKTASLQKHCDIPALVIFFFLRAVSQPFSLSKQPLYSERILKAKTHHFDTQSDNNATAKKAKGTIEQQRQYEK